MTASIGALPSAGRIGALTNVVKHAPGAPVSIGLHWLPGSLEIDVRDRGPGARGVPSPDAHGLAGMREGVRIHGGEFQAGNVDGAGSPSGRSCRSRHRGERSHR
jgi:glucose-6-phosphate-specific signal transduction histidine kinase